MKYKKLSTYLSNKYDNRIIVEKLCEKMIVIKIKLDGSFMFITKSTLLKSIKEYLGKDYWLLTFSIFTDEIVLTLEEDENGN